MVWSSAVSGYLGSKGSSKAAKQLAQAINTATAEQKRQFNITDEQLAPYRDVGPNALAAYQGLATPEGQFDYLQSHPLYEYLNKQAADRATDSMIAGGKSFSGQGAKTVQAGLYDLSEGLVNNALNRYGGLIDTGLGATTQTAGLRQNLANSLSNLTLQGGNAAAAGTVGKYNAYADSINQLAKLGGTFLTGGI